MPLVDQVAVIGAAVWTEERLFELEGRWSRDEPDAEVAVHLATYSRLHGAHAAGLADCLPDSPALEADAHVRAPGPAWEAIVNDEVPPGSSQRLVVVERLVARTFSGYEALASRLSPVADGPTQRVLDQVLVDQGAELVASRSLLARRSGETDIDALRRRVDARLDGSA